MEITGAFGPRAGPSAACNFVLAEANGLGPNGITSATTMAFRPSGEIERPLGCCLLMETSTSATPGIIEGRISRISQETEESYPRLRCSDASTSSLLGSFCSATAGLKDLVAERGCCSFERASPAARITKQNKTTAMDRFTFAPQSVCQKTARKSYHPATRDLPWRVISPYQCGLA